MTNPQPVHGDVEAAITASLGHLRRLDPDIASDVDTVRRTPRRFPTVVVVGETKRGKSSLINALLDAPGLSPVDASVATSAYLEFRYAEQTGAQAIVPDDPRPVPLTMDQLRDWATVLGELPPDAAAPREIQVYHQANLLRYVSVIDTPGVGGLDSLHADIALDAVGKATALLFVVDASAPFSQPELDFLSQSSRKVNTVFFALTKIDAYPGWRTILDDNKELLQAHAPRFASAPFFPVSACLAELSEQLSTDPAAKAELWKEAKVGPLRGALGKIVSAQAPLLHDSNILRAIRTELVMVDTGLAQRQRAADPDPETLAQLKEERANFANRKRKDARTWSLTLSTENRRARTDVTASLRSHIQQIQDAYMTIIDKASGDRLKALPYEIDRTLQGLSLRLSSELEHRFRNIGGRVLAEVFTHEELHMVLSRLNARLRSAVQSKPQRDASGDTLLALASTAGMSMMAGRGASMGVAAALGSGGALGLAVPVVGIGVGLAAGAFMLWRRKSGQDRQGAKVWLREVLAEARACMSDEIAHRFTELEFALTVALDEAVERRMQQLDEQIAQIDKSMADDKAQRAKRKAAIQGDRDQIRGRVKNVDDVLNKVRAVLKAPPPRSKAAGPTPPPGMPLSAGGASNGS